MSKPSKSDKILFEQIVHKIGYLYEKNGSNITSQHTKKVNLKWTTGLNIKDETIKFLEYIIKK